MRDVIPITKIEAQKHIIAEMPETMATLTGKKADRAKPIKIPSSGIDTAIVPGSVKNSIPLVSFDIKIPTIKPVTTKAA